ncbi:MAG: hypothetical protein V7K27_01740 [Nostoc sp.]|uniref:hypothetical protein n=1 Tax=Nostoc sp. TaxID=1180 RepID=UPI002FFBE8F5
MINNTQETAGILRFSNCTNAEKFLTANISDVVLNANTTRSYAAFVNNSSVDLTLVLGDKTNALINKGIILKPHGGSYEINSTNLYIGKISAIATNNCRLSFVECTE